MLEYSLEDAEKLLTSNMATAKKNLSCVEHDLDFLRYVTLYDSYIFYRILYVDNCIIKLMNKLFYNFRDQCTTTEVNMARVYNWDVKRRQTTSNT